MEELNNDDIDDNQKELEHNDNSGESKIATVYRFIKTFKLTSGANLNNAPIPISFISSKSTLYNFIEGFTSNFDLLINLNNIEDKMERMCLIYRWNASALSHNSVFGKPISILGETLCGNFHYKDENDNLETENYYYTERVSDENEQIIGCIFNKNHGVKVVYDYTVNYYFMGTNIRVELLGECKVRLEKFNETYYCTPPQLSARFLRGFSEVVGEGKVISKENSRYKLLTKYFEKPLIGGDYDKVEIQLYDNEANEPIKLMQGKWSSDFTIKDLKTKQVKPYFKRPPKSSIVQLNEDKSLPSDSNNVWKSFIDAHNDNNNSKKSQEKNKVEKKQKQLSDERKKNNIEYKPSLFIKDQLSNTWDLINY